MSSQAAYFSVESPHKRRPKNHFWKIVAWLGFLIAILVAAIVAKHRPYPSLGSPSSSLSGISASDNSPMNQPLHAKKSPQHRDEDNNNNKVKMVDVEAMDKKAWPELVGQDAEVAKATIQLENPSITLVQIIPKDSMVTMDYSTSRVRIFVNTDNTVASPPRIG